MLESNYYWHYSRDASSRLVRYRYRFWPVELGTDPPRHDAPGVITVRVFAQDGFPGALSKAGLEDWQCVSAVFVRRLIGQASQSA
jgi:hypothetical protein